MRLSYCPIVGVSYLRLQAEQDASLFSFGFFQVPIETRMPLCLPFSFWFFVRILFSQVALNLPERIPKNYISKRLSSYFSLIQLYQTLSQKSFSGFIVLFTEIVWKTTFLLTVLVLLSINALYHCLLDPLFHCRTNGSWAIEGLFFLVFHRPPSRRKLTIFFSIKRKSFVSFFNFLQNFVAQFFVSCNKQRAEFSLLTAISGKITPAAQYRTKDLCFFSLKQRENPKRSLHRIFSTLFPLGSTSEQYLKCQQTA